MPAHWDISLVHSAVGSPTLASALGEEVRLHWPEMQLYSRQRALVNDGTELPVNSELYTFVQMLWDIPPPVQL